MLGATSRNIIIEGVVCRPPTDARRGLIVFLKPWRFLRAWSEAGEPVRGWNPITPLRVRIRIDEQGGREGLALGVAVRIACETVESPPKGAASWAAVSSRMPQEMQSSCIPMLVRDRWLGVLALDKRTNTLSGTRTNRRYQYRYELFVERAKPGDSRSVDHDLDRARTVVKTIEFALARIREDVGARLAVCYNTRWRGHRARLARAQIVARTQLTSVRIAASGRAMLGFSDGDLFLGHWIEVTLDAHLRVGAIQIAGVQQVA